MRRDGSGEGGDGIRRKGTSPFQREVVKRLLSKYAPAWNLQPEIQQNKEAGDHLGNES
jgi:hypothetical protein